MKRATRFIAVIAAAAATLSTGTAHAQVFKCKDANGTTVFASQPCGAGAQAIDVRPASGAARTPPLATTTAPASSTAIGESAAPRSLTQRADDAARRRILDDDIYRKQRELNALQEELSARQAQLREKKRHAANNLAGATWEQSISDEMQAVAAEYDIKIRRVTKELDELKARKAQIPN